VGLEDELTGCSQVVRGGCSFAWNFTVTRSTVVTGVQREDTRPNMMLFMHK
jgi:hypothetical protein